MYIEAINFETDEDAAQVIRAMHTKHKKREQELLRRIAKLESALRYYANPKQWGEDTWGVRAIIQGEYGEAGRRAQKALGIYKKRRALRR